MTVGPVRVTATFADHDGRRPPLGPAGPPLGFLLEEGPTKVYFAGDTDIFPGMVDLAPRLDVAMLPVWGWGPRLGHGHMNPRRAAEALRLLTPRYAVPIHWGTLWPYGLGRVVPGRLTDPPREFARFARRYAPAVQVLLTPPGQPVSFDPEGPDPALRMLRAKPPRPPRLPGDARDASSAMTVGPTTGSIPSARDRGRLGRVHLVDEERVDQPGVEAGDPGRARLRRRARRAIRSAGPLSARPPTRGETAATRTPRARAASSRARMPGTARMGPIETNGFEGQSTIASAPPAPRPPRGSGAPPRSRRRPPRARRAPGGGGRSTPGRRASHPASGPACGRARRPSAGSAS